MCGKTEHDDMKKGSREELLCGPEISFAGGKSISFLHTLALGCYLNRAEHLPALSTLLS